MPNAASLKKAISSHADINVIHEESRAGGGSLPETDFPTSVVSIRPLKLSVNTLEERLRNCETPVIVRIKGDALLIDPRTVLDKELKTLVNCVIASFNNN